MSSTRLSGIVSYEFTTDSRILLSLNFLRVQNLFSTWFGYNIYKLVSGLELFNIDPTGQKITLTGQLDRETSASHTLCAFSDSSSPLTAVTEISLRVLDCNDNRPQFHSDVYNIMIAEILEEGSSILKVHADDGDEGANGEVRYLLIGPGSDVFVIDSHKGWITILVWLDRQMISSYTLTIIATDSGSPELSPNATVHVSVIDYNDNPPRFLKDFYVAAGKICIHE